MEEVRGVFGRTDYVVSHLSLMRPPLILVQCFYSAAALLGRDLNVRLSHSGTVGLSKRPKPRSRFVRHRRSRIGAFDSMTLNGLAIKHAIALCTFFGATGQIQ